MANRSEHTRATQAQSSGAGVNPGSLTVPGAGPPGRYAIGSEFWDDSPLAGGGQKLWRVQVNTAGTAKEWVQATGAGASGSSWPNYVVSADADIPANFTTVTSAYAAAKVATHGAANPCSILIHPDTYAAALTLDTPGINLLGLAPPGVSSPILSGAVSITAAGSVLIGNIVFIAAMTASSASKLSLVMDGVFVTPPDATAALTWTAAAGSQLTLTDCALLSGTGATLDASTAVTLAITARDTLFSTSKGSVALRLNDASSDGQRFTSCAIDGEVVISVGAAPTNQRLFEQCRFTTSGAAVPAVSTAAGASTTQATFVDCTFSCTNNTATFGRGTDGGEFTMFAPSFLSPTLGNSVVTLKLSAGLSSFGRPWVTINATGAVPATARGVLTDTTAGAVVLTLPDIRSFLDGESIEFKRSVANANDLTISGVGGAGGTVDGAASIILADNAIIGCAVLRADRANAVWRVISVFGL